MVQSLDSGRAGRMLNDMSTTRPRTCGCNGATQMQMYASGFCTWDTIMFVSPRQNGKVGDADLDRLRNDSALAVIERMMEDAARIRLPQRDQPPCDECGGTFVPLGRGTVQVLRHRASCSRFTDAQAIAALYEVPIEMVEGAAPPRIVDEWEVDGDAFMRTMLGGSDWGGWTRTFRPGAGSWVAPEPEPDDVPDP